MMFHGVPNDTAVAMDDEKLDVRNLSIMDFCMPDPPIFTTVHCIQVCLWCGGG